MFASTFHTRLRQNLMPLLLIATLLAACSGHSQIATMPVDTQPTSPPIATAQPLSSETPLPPPTPTSEPRWTLFTDGNAVRDLAFRVDGTLWAATAGGVLAWNVTDQTYTKYTTLDGLPSNQVGQLAAAPDGSLVVCYRQRSAAL